MPCLWENTMIDNDWFFEECECGDLRAYHRNGIGGCEIDRAFDDEVCGCDGYRPRKFVYTECEYCVDWVRPAGEEGNADYIKHIIYNHLAEAVSSTQTG